MLRTVEIRRAALSGQDPERSVAPLDRRGSPSPREFGLAAEFFQMTEVVAGQECAAEEGAVVADVN